MEAGRGHDGVDGEVGSSGDDTAWQAIQKRLGWW